MFSKDQEITNEAVNKKLSEIISARGKKGTDRNTQIELLIGRTIFLCRLNLDTSSVTKCHLHNQFKLCNLHLIVFGSLQN